MRKPKSSSDLCQIVKSSGAVLGRTFWPVTTSSLFFFFLQKRQKDIQHKVTAEGPLGLEPRFAFSCLSPLAPQYRARKRRIKTLLLNAPQLGMPKKKTLRSKENWQLM